jgi:hypothetical protein
MKKTFVLFILVGAFYLTNAQSNYKFHSVFIYSFTRYIQWPEAYSTGDFEITVLGDSPQLLEELKALAQAKKVGDRSIKITRINTYSEIRKCHILFVASGKSQELNDVLNKIDSQSILVLTEEPGLAAKGSDINFVQKDNKPAIELNQQTISKKNLKVSNELSRLAILI